MLLCGRVWMLTPPTVEPGDWRAPPVHYLENHDHGTDRKVRQQALKYILPDHGLYRQTIDGLLLRCLGSDQSKVAMGDFMMKYAEHISQLLCNDWLL
jgi:hypothetical protein